MAQAISRAPQHERYRAMKNVADALRKRLREDKLDGAIEVLAMSINARLATSITPKKPRRFVQLKKMRRSAK